MLGDSRREAPEFGGVCKQRAVCHKAVDRLRRFRIAIDVFVAYPRFRSDLSKVAVLLDELRA